MNRRDFLTATTADVPVRQDFSSVMRTQSGLAPYTGSWTISEVTHLLRRSMFGTPKADVDYFLGLGLNDAIDTLLERINHPAYVPPSPPLNYYSASVNDPNCPPGQPWPGTADTFGTGMNTFSYRRRSLKYWWYSQMLNQPRSLREKMTLFWSNHFVVEMDIVTVGTYLYKHNALLREYALGDFREFTKQVTINSAMLKYLNGDKNTASAPNENYARELQELFTVGKDANGNPQYTEDDVREAARALTGWRNDLVGGTQSANGFNSYFDPTRHDNQDKIFSSWYNNTVITGRSGSAGADELDDLLDMIFARQEVAEHICRKLYRWFVYYEIDAAAEANVIQPLAAIFRNSGYDISTALDALFRSEHFFDVLNRGCVIKSPIDMVVGLFREYGVPFPDDTNLAAQYGAWSRMQLQTQPMQQDAGDPPGVAGWQAYYQEPSYHEMWINSDTLPKRNQFSDRMTGSGYTNNGFNLKIDVVGYTSTLTNPGDPEALIDEVLALHYAIDAGPALKAYLLSILLSGQSTNSYWTTAWDDYTGDPTNTSYYNIVKTRLQSFYKYIMNLTEYQLS